MRKRQVGTDSEKKTRNPFINLVSILIAAASLSAINKSTDTNPDRQERSAMSKISQKLVNYCLNNFLAKRSLTWLL